MTLNIQGDDYNAPTNPQLISTTSDFSDGDRIYTAITSHGGVSLSISGWGGTVAEYSNLHTTKGFRIKCYDALTTDGIRFNPTAQNLIDNDYFVLLYSDTPFQHHFAKITEVITEDIEGDAFEFSPKLGNEIPKGTKFAIFQMGKDDDVVAVSLGLLQDSTPTDYIDQLARRMVVARPLFYFYPGLDKKDELNHNVKYYAMRECGTANSYTLDNTDPAITFITRQDFGKTIIDYSKYSHRVTLTDVLRTLDETNTATNEGETGFTATAADYNTIYRNARRIADDIITTPTYTGPSRYLHYDFSPLKANIAYNVYEHTHTESIEGKGGFAETSIIDSARIMPKKVKEFAEYRVRQDVHRGELNAFFSVKATYSSQNSAYRFVFAIEYDLRDVLNSGDEVRCGSDLYLVDTVAAPSGKTQEITFKSLIGNVLSRTATEAEFTLKYSKTPTVGDVLERRAYSAQGNTLMLDTHLLNDRFSKLYVAFSSLNLNERFASVTASNSTIGMITLSFSDDAYSGNPLSYTDGNYVLYIERFNGEVENIESRKEDNQTIMSIQGRDKFSKLLSPVVNLNTLFSEDIIYSTQSPYNKLVLMDGNNFSISLGDTSLDTGLTFSQFTNIPAVGDHLFTVNGYIGEVTNRSVNGSLEFTLTFSRGALTEANSEQIYVSKEKNYVFNKALGSSHLATNKPTSLTGSANKGIFFTAGNEINSDGTEGNSLVGSSVNTSDGAIGYSINKPSSISNDFAFQSKLHDEYGSADPASFDTVNTLIDFEVVSVTKKDGKSTIEIAPYLPLTLGRKIENHEDTTGYTFTSIGTVANPAYSGSFIYSSISLEGANTANIEIGKAVFLVHPPGSSKVFLGYIIGFSSTTTYSGYSANISLSNDSPYGTITTGTELFVAETNNHSLAFTNGSHLWGGKTLILPHPILKTDGAVPLNFKSPHSSSLDTNKKFGQLYYKLQDIKIGALEYNKDTNLLVYDDQTDSIPALFFEKAYTSPSLYRFYSTVYQFKPNTSNDNLIEYGKTGSVNKHLSLDERGHVNTKGSNIPDSMILNRSEEKNRRRSATSVPYIKRELEPINNAALRNFLYITGDLLPYSSKRKDSLMDGNKTVNKYNLFLLEDNNIEDTATNFGNRKLLTEENFQTVSFQTETDISSLNRFSMMRLTEVGYDFLFNPMNVEEKTLGQRQVVGSNRNRFFAIGLAINYISLGTINASDTITEHATNPDKIIFAASVSLSVGDIIVDSEGHLIGVISSGSGTTWTLNEDFKYKLNKVIPTGTIYKYTEDGSEYTGRGNKNSFTTLDSFLHLQKSAIIPSGTTASTDSHYGQTEGDAYSLNGNADIAIPSGFELALPIVLESGTLSTSGVDSATHSVIASYFSGSSAYKNQLAVCLDRFDIEDGGLNKLEAGLVTPLLGDIKSFDIGSYEVVGVSTSKHFKEYKYPRSYVASSNYSTSAPFNADGMFMGIKLRLYVDSGNQTNSDLISSNGNLKKYVFDTSTENKFLEFCDLTGCYLVSEKGENIFGDEIDTSNAETFATSMNRVIPDEIVYIVSHETDPTNAQNNILVLDGQLTNNIAYRIMQPNSVFMWDFTPKEIIPYMCSSEYTKMPNENKTYNIKTSYLVQDGKGDGDATDSVSEEAYLSMYVIIDPDKQDTSDKLVRRSFDYTFNNGNYYVSDGLNKKKLNIKTTAATTSTATGLSFSETFYSLGVVSISETITLFSNEEVKLNPTRACIGSTVSIGLEGEDLINELLEQEGIEFETTGTDIPLYLAPNYQGVDLYSAIRYVLDRKEMKLIEENDVFKIIPDDEDAYYTDITIDDSGNYLIQDFEKVSTLFDFYNEIIVYGNANKATRKDIRSIQKRGRKTLEVVDGSLLTQEEVDKQAQKLLRIHSTLNQKLTLTMSSKGINQLRPGDIINVEITRENIEMSQYIVLQMEHNITGFMKLELGRYSKDLSDVFAELLVSNKQTKAALRSNDLASNEISYNFLNTLDTKELKLLVRKRASSGGATLGFGTELGFEAELGFEGGATITITDLLEEDLA